MAVSLDQRGVFSGREAARYLRMRGQRLADLAREGAFPGAYRTDLGHWRIPRADLDAYEDLMRTEARAS